MTIRLTHTKLQRQVMPTAELGFGRQFADHMFLMDYVQGEGWHNARIEPYGPITIEPSNLTLHYGQTIFEGLKAFRWPDGTVHFFRINDHMERFARSAERLCIPQVDQTFMAEAIASLVDVDRRWVPSQPGTSLYVRPTIIAMDNMLGVRPAHRYLLFVISSPVGNYYSRGLTPTRILVEEKFSRVAPGGLGEAKTAANYAASLLAAERAREHGFDQVLWLDAKEHRFVEEVGTMNIFFVIDDVLVTPALNGSILDGITRRTVLQLASDWSVRFEERPIEIEEIVNASREGRLQEAFGSGTAVVISTIGEFSYRGETIVVEERPNPLRARLYEAISDICGGGTSDSHGWTSPAVRSMSLIRKAEDLSNDGIGTNVVRQHASGEFGGR